MVFALSRNKLYVEDAYEAAVVKPAGVLAFLAKAFDGFLDALARLFAPDRQGRPDDVVLGFDTQDKRRRSGYRRFTIGSTDVLGYPAAPESLFADPSVYVDETTLDQDNYEASHRVTAGYLSLDVPFGARLRGIGPARHQLGADHEAAAPDLTEDTPLAHRELEPVQQARPHRRGVGDEIVLFHQPDVGERGRAGVGELVRAPRDAHQVAVQRHHVGQRCGHHRLLAGHVFERLRRMDETRGVVDGKRHQRHVPRGQQVRQVRRSRA